MSVEPVVSVIGLGYVGLPVAVAMSAKFKVVGFDTHAQRIEELKSGEDRTQEVEESELRSANITYTTDVEVLREANFHIVAVPTPINSARQPDLTMLLKASETVGKALKKGDIVVYESTVYPGATEEDCVPVLEEFSQLKAGVDFKVGYSPERINPGDKEHSFTKIKKVISAQDDESLERVAMVYGSVVEAGLFKAESIRVAEAAKVIENTQRDLNIALMNELSLIFDRLNIDTLSVLEAASTKWNFLPFKPGLVGGHCIGVDPYYLTYRAEKADYHPQVILSGRRINDQMGRFIVHKMVKVMAANGQNLSQSRVTVLGLTFKENCPDLRNTRVTDIVNELAEYGMEVQVCDPMADPEEARQHYGIDLTPFAELKPADAMIAAVPHKEFAEMNDDDFLKVLTNSAVVFDVKGLFDKSAFAGEKIRLVRI